MKYNAEYDRWVTTGGLIYRYDNVKDKLVLCKQSKWGCGYLRIRVNHKSVHVHKIVYETFNGKIKQGYEIDHFNTKVEDNNVSNLICVTHKVNCNNPLTKKHKSEALRGNTNVRNKTWSDFGMKFKEHYGITRMDNLKLYHKELQFYHRHNKKCSWE